MGTKPLRIEDVESGAGGTREGKTRPSVGGEERYAPRILAIHGKPRLAADEAVEAGIWGQAGTQTVVSYSVEIIMWLEPGGGSDSRDLTSLFRC